MTWWRSLGLHHIWVALKSCFSNLLYQKKQLIFLDNLIPRPLCWCRSLCNGPQRKMPEIKKKKSENTWFWQTFLTRGGRFECHLVSSHVLLSFSPVHLPLWVAQGQAGSRLQRPQHCSYPGTRSPTACGQRSSSNLCPSAASPLTFLNSIYSSN